jgi:tetratricopeptide (TPR) repeat protein
MATADFPSHLSVNLVFPMCSRWSVFRAFVALVFTIEGSVAYAEVLEIEGTVKAVDASARTLRLDRQTPTGTETLELEVGKKAGDMSTLKAGGRITFRYDPDLELITKIQNQWQLASTDAIDPSRVANLTLEEARRLAASAGETLSLPRVRHLSEAVAKELATYRDESGTCTYRVDVQVRERRTCTHTALIPQKEQRTREDGTTYVVITPRAVERTQAYTVTKSVPETKEHKCPLTLMLAGLESAEPRVLAALAKHDGHLSLPGLKTLSRDGALSLSGHSGGTLALDGLASLDVETAEQLANHQGTLSLNGLESLSTDAATALCKSNNSLSLNGLVQLSDDLAEIFARRNAPVFLQGVRKASEAAVYSLATKPGALSAVILPKQSRLARVAALYAEGSFKEAQVLAQQEVTAGEEEVAHGPVATAGLASSLSWLGSIYQRQENYGDAEIAFTRALELYESWYGSEHPEYSDALSHLAGLYTEQGKADQAEPLFREALRIQEPANDPRRRNVANVFNGLARCCAEQGKHEEAIHYYEKALTLFEERDGPNSPNVQCTLKTVGDLYRELDKPEMAEPLYTQALAIQESTSGANSPALIDVLCDLADVYADLGRPKDANLMLSRALPITEKAYGPGHRLSKAIREELAERSGKGTK